MLGRGAQRASHDRTALPIPSEVLRRPQSLSLRGAARARRRPRLPDPIVLVWIQCPAAAAG